MSNLEDMRREMVADLITQEPTCLVMREGADVPKQFPYIFVEFSGPSLRKYAWVSSTIDGHESWTMQEMCTIVVATIEPRIGIDESRLTLQTLVDSVEAYTRTNFPALFRSYGCSVYYKDSWKTVNRYGKYNEQRVNYAIIPIAILEPRTLADADYTGPLVERANIIAEDYDDHSVISIDSINIDMG